MISETHKWHNEVTFVVRSPKVKVFEPKLSLFVTFSLFFAAILRRQKNGNVTLIKKGNIRLNLSTSYENNFVKIPNLLSTMKCFIEIEFEFWRLKSANL